MVGVSQLRRKTEKQIRCSSFTTMKLLEGIASPQVQRNLSKLLQARMGYNLRI